MPLPALSNGVLDGDEELVKSLLAGGEDPNEISWGRLRALHWACSGEGRPNMVRHLLRAGADPNAQNSFGSAPLHYACYGGHAECARVLLDEGNADFSAHDIVT
jgi:ankyrin repeat protein